MKRLRLPLLLLLGSCAMAGSETESDDTPSSGADANVSQGFPDARPFADAAADAAAIPDATSSAFDAAPSSTSQDAGLFCESSTECTAANTCCFSLGGSGLCVPGAEVLGVCVPD